MSDQIEFLRESAERLRACAHIAPDIAAQLHALAAELDAQANRMEAELPRH